MQMPKKGMVFNDGTKQPYVDYKVNARWVTEYVQARICPNSLKNMKEPLALQSLLFLLNYCGEPWALQFLWFSSIAEIVLGYTHLFFT